LSTHLHLGLPSGLFPSGMPTNIFWYCKWYEGQWVSKDYPKSVTELLRLEERRFLQGVCYFINNIPVFI
jgi:hypothetical protein